MDFYTMNDQFIKQEPLDDFESIIWTERYHGDNEVTIVSEATPDMFSKLNVGDFYNVATFVGCSESNEPAMLETVEIADGRMTSTGISITEYFKNRFIRSSPFANVTEWIAQQTSAGEVIWEIVRQWCTSDSTFLVNPPVSDTYPDPGMGVYAPEWFIIPGLRCNDRVDSGENIDFTVPFGPVYDAIKDIATGYNIGMKTTLEYARDDGYSLAFNTYKGIDRTSSQSVVPVVQFSQELDSLKNIKEIHSIKDFVTEVSSWSSNVDPAVTSPGSAGTDRGFTRSQTGNSPQSFLLRAAMRDDDITTEQLAALHDSPTNDGPLGPQSEDVLLGIKLQKDGDIFLKQHPFVKLVDGEIVPTNEFKYGRDYFMGDIVDIVGHSGIRRKAQITEYIRSRDKTGETEYPTVSIIE